MKITPNIGTNLVTLGDTEEEIISKLGQPDKKINRSQSRPELKTYFYRNYLMMVEIDETGKTISIEWANKEPAEYEGTDIFTLNFEESLDFFKKLGEKVDVNDDGYQVNKLGIAIYAPQHTEDKHCKIEGVLVHGHGYY